MNTHTHATHRIQHQSVGRHPDRPVNAPARVSARPTEEPSDEISGGFFAFLRGYPIVLGITLLAAALFITVAAFILYRSPDPAALIPPASAAVVGLASLCGGMTAGKLNPSRAVPAGLVCGVLTAALLLLLSLAFGGEMGVLSWLLRGSTILIHTAGGILARPRSRRSAHTAGKHPSRR